MKQAIIFQETSFCFLQTVANVLLLGAQAGNLALMFTSGLKATTTKWDLSEYYKLSIVDATITVRYC